MVLYKGLSMISKIIEYSGRNRFFVFLVVLFLSLWGIWSLQHIPLDAIPDLSDTQVIVYTDWPGRSPNLVEDQVTYPISSTLLAAPKVQAVRGFSFLGSSFIYVIFEEGTDIYWARSRVLEYLQSVRSKIPADVNPVLGPDATSLGWGFSYALVDETGEPRPFAAPVAPGLEHQARARERARRVAGGERRRLRAAVPDHRGAEPARVLRHLAHEGDGRRPEEQHRRGRPGPGAVRHGVHGARPGLHHGRQGPAGDRRGRWARAARPCSCATWPTWRWAPRSGAASRTWTAGARWPPASWWSASARTCWT